MGISWTEEQQRVISLGSRNILVAAAAGSGKTAVLVERIIEKICSPQNPVDLDRLLVVTFTNAAAAEMRQRIGEAIEAKVETEPDNPHLLRQLTLIHHAPITTIHSFCLSVIRNYFHTIDLDPAFRIGDEGELKLLQEDVAAQLLERHYKDPEENFEAFVDLFASGKDDSSIAEMIRKLYLFSQSYPWPKEWLEECAGNYEIENEKQLAQTPWMKFFLEYYRSEMREFALLYEELLALCEKEGGPAPYLAVFSGEAECIRCAQKADSYEEAWRSIQTVTFGRKPRKKKTDLFEEAIEKRVVGLRDQVKDGIKSMKKNYFSRTPQQMAEDIRRAAPFAQVLTQLTIEFGEAYTLAKRKKNLLDFGDLEHLALDILTEKRDGKNVPSAVADQYSKHFAEILVDEYQDSNYVQEALIQSLSGERFGRPNVLMVGDVKQSIYQFRLAKPELFLEKYKTYSTEESDRQKIELHQNFRSRASVLKGVNFLFYQIMRAPLGGIAYTKETALHPGLVYADAGGALESRTGGPVEGLLMETPSTGPDERYRQTGESEMAAEDLTEREWEARMVGERILALTDPTAGQMVWDKEKNGYRAAQLRDIVILLRTMSGWAEPFVNTLMGMGISACAESRSGYFTTVEVRTVLNFLRIIDNPMQDIPLAAVLHSPIGTFTSQELAWIKASYPPEREGGLWEAVIFRLEHSQNQAIDEKLRRFWEQLEQFRDQASYQGMHDLLLDVLQKTGYYDYVSLMPGGERRRANLDMLLQKALTYETTSYRGVFHFVRYIEKLQKFDVDFGEASVVGEQENTVRIMSIHKSKGLEFPIVILAGIAKPFNRQDANKKILMHPDFGIGMDAVNPELRTKTPTLLKKAIQKKMMLDNSGEELRILYVALTRAKEKLIVSGAKKNLTEWMSRRMDGALGASISQETLNQASSYLEFLLPALCRHRASVPIWERVLLPPPVENNWYDGQNLKKSKWDAWMEMEEDDYDRLFLVTLWSADALSEQSFRKEQKRAVQREEFYEWDTHKVWDPPFVREIEEKFSYRYRYDKLSRIHATMSVSELKKESQAQEEAAVMYPLAGEEEKTIPRFMMDQEADVSPSVRGTIYHRVMEEVRFEPVMSEASIRTQMAEMVRKGRLTEQEAAIVRLKKIMNFFTSALYPRLYAADQNGLLFREQRFIAAISPEEIQIEGEEDLPVADPTRSDHPFAMIQGIIDLYFEEEDGIVLMDYKTDRVSKEEELTARYQVQLDCYERALEQMTGKKVKERYLYSFAMEKWIRA